MKTMYNLLVQTSAEFIEHGSMHNLKWMQIRYPAIHVSEEDLSRCKYLQDLRNRQRDGRMIAGVDATRDYVAIMYCWCLMYHRQFDLFHSFERFMVQVNRNNWLPIKALHENYEHYVRFYFEYIHKLLDREAHEKHGMHVDVNARRLSYLYVLLKRTRNEEDLHVRYHRLMEDIGAPYTADSTIDRYFLGLIKREEIELYGVSYTLG